MREGKDVTIVAFSRMVQFALEAADKLAQEGIQAEVCFFPPFFFFLFSFFFFLLFCFRLWLGAVCA
jgi:transketolase